MRKIVKLSLILLMIMCITGSVYAALTCTVSIQTAKTELNKGEEFVVDVNLSNLPVDKGIIALGATLEYDKDSLTLVKMEGKNGWSTPSYNEANGKIVMDRNGFATSDETMFQITFKVKDQVSGANQSITLKDISVADGDEESTVATATKSITIKEETPVNPGGNTNNNGNTNSNTNTNTGANNSNGTKDNSVTNGKLPQTGEDNIIPVLLVGLVILAIVLYTRSKMIDKKIK